MTDHDTRLEEAEKQVKIVKSNTGDASVRADAQFIVKLIKNLRSEVNDD